MLINWLLEKGYEQVAYLILVPVHSRQSADMSEDVLDGIGELEGINVSETVLNVGIDDEFSQTKDFTTQVEGVAKTGYLSFLVVRVLETCVRGTFSVQNRVTGVLNRLQVHAVIEVQMVQILRCLSA